MEQNDSEVVGTYEYPSTAGQMYGQIEGQVEGDRLNLIWWQDTVEGVSYAEAPQRGEAYFILSEDGNSIAGEWRGENQEGWAGEWDFIRE